MLKFGAKSQHPLGDARSAERWFASLPVNDPLSVQRSLVEELRKLTVRAARRTPTVLEAVFVVDAHADGLVRKLTAQYLEHARRSAKIEDQLWTSLFELAQGFQDCYLAFAREITEPRPRGKWHAVLARLIGRQIIHLGRDAKLRLFRCERWIPSKWADLFRPFTQACGYQIEREPFLLDPAGHPTTIEREFLSILLLQLGDPGNITAKEIEWIAAQLDGWCQPLRLTLRPVSPNTFYVDLAGESGLHRRSAAPLEGRVLFVDLRPLHALLLQNRATLEQAVRGEPRSARKSRHRQELDLFVKLASRIDPDFKPLARRGERAPASGGVDAIVGFPNISTFLRGSKTMSIAEPPVRLSYGDTMELAVFGRTIHQTKYQREPAADRLSAFVSPGGPWEMKDVSASGLRLHAAMSVAMELKLSMLVAIRRPETDTWALGIIRRMRRLSTREADIGLQLIADALASAELVELRDVRESDYSVSGEDPSITGRTIHGLFLSFSRRAEESPVQSLIVPAVEHHPSRRYTLRVGDSARTIRSGIVLERHADWIWTVIEPVSSAKTDGTDSTD